MRDREIRTEGASEETRERLRHKEKEVGSERGKKRKENRSRGSERRKRKGRDVERNKEFGEGATERQTGQERKKD